VSVRCSLKMGLRLLKSSFTASPLLGKASMSRPSMEGFSTDGRAAARVELRTLRGPRTQIAV
jgi:hypothetical protein